MMAINYYQPRLRPFLQWQKTWWSDEIEQYYYHSWEDAVWDLINNKFLQKTGLVFLVPDFYCVDVVDNIKSSGHKIVTYELDKHFQTDVRRFGKLVKSTSPDIVIIFHAAGITANLSEKSEWKKSLKPSTIIIEDSVHRLISVDELKGIDDRTVVIDSLRKVSPLPGSRMFASKKMLNFPVVKRPLINQYVVKSTYWYILFRIIFRIGFGLNIPRLVAYAHEIILRKYDDIIGDEKKSQPGPRLMLPLINRIDTGKVEAMKKIQAEKYIKELSKVFSGKYFYKMNIPVKDWGKLHVYPLGFNIRPKKELEEYLHKLGIIVWFKFTDCLWSKNKGVLFLPLGFHMDEGKISYIAKSLENYEAQKL